MNKFLNFFTTILFISTAILMSCGSSSDDTDPIDPEDVQAALLTANTWVAASVIQGTVAAEGWDSFELTLTYNAETNTGGFTTTGRNADSEDIVWPASGAWSFGSTTAQVVRDDNVTMTVNVTATAATLAFTVTDPNGRLLTFGGSYDFRMEPKP